MVSRITYVTGDLFAAPAGTILVHACNTLGSWHGGIATAFLEKYPTMFQAYKEFCESQGSALLGKCMLIPGEPHNQAHDIACLFTSEAYGKKKDSPDRILIATRSAVRDLMEKNTAGKEMHACRFNAGKFAVPWERTEEVLNELGISMTVYDPPADVLAATRRSEKTARRGRGRN